MEVAAEAEAFFLAGDDEALPGALQVGHHADAVDGDAGLPGEVAE